MPTESDRVLMLMFEKSMKHCKSLCEALEDLVEAAEEHGLDDKLHVAISDAYRAIQEYKAATYACGKCGAIKEDHKCSPLAPPMRTPKRFKIGRWRFSLWRHGGFKWGVRFDNRTAGSVSFGLGCLTFMRTNS